MSAQYSSFFINYWCVLAAIIAAVQAFLPISGNPDHIHFYLYPDPTRVNHKKQIHLFNYSSLDSSSFKPATTTVIIIHGLWTDHNDPMFQALKNAYLSTPFGGNYIIVDWSRLSRGFTIGLDFPLIYAKAVENTQITAQVIANFIIWLGTFAGVQAEQVHVLGHSLGAHVAGKTGYFYQGYTGGRKIARITGFDPASPGFDPNFFHTNWTRKITREDALFVDLYHTTPWVAVTSSDGHADFWPNYSHSFFYHQPGCLPRPFDVTSCSHNFGVHLYAASLKKPFISCKCDKTWNDSRLKECMSSCPDPVLAGAFCPPMTRGDYFLMTGKL